MVAHAEVVYRLCKQAAEAGQPAPSNAEIRRVLGISSKGTAALVVQLLVNQGRVKVLRGPIWRIVIAADGSWRTAKPVHAHPLDEVKRPAPQPLTMPAEQPTKSTVKLAPKATGFYCGPPPSGCLWISGDENDRSTWVYCDDAQVPGRPYCVHHCTKAYVPERKRRRAEAA